MTRSRSPGARTSPNWSDAVLRRKCSRRRRTARWWTKPSALRRSWTSVHDHIWDAVNAHLGTSAGIVPGTRRATWHYALWSPTARGRHILRLRPDSLRGGTARLRCVRLRSQPGGLHAYVGRLQHHRCRDGEPRDAEAEEQRELLRRVSADIDELGVETDGEGWQAKGISLLRRSSLPANGWMVPLLPTRVVSKGHHAIVELVPDALHKRYDIVIRSGVTKTEFAAAIQGTVRSDGRGQDPYLIHTVDDTEYRTKISTLRGDYRRADGGNGNRLRMWEKARFQAATGRHLPGALICHPVDAREEEWHSGRV